MGGAGGDPAELPGTAQTLRLTPGSDLATRIEVVADALDEALALQLSAGVANLLAVEAKLGGDSRGAQEVGFLEPFVSRQLFEYCVVFLAGLFTCQSWHKLSQLFQLATSVKTETRNGGERRRGPRARKVAARHALRTKNDVPEALRSLAQPVTKTSWRRADTGMDRPLADGRPEDAAAATPAMRTSQRAPLYWTGFVDSVAGNMLYFQAKPKLHCRLRRVDSHQ